MNIILHFPEDPEAKKALSKQAAIFHAEETLKFFSSSSPLPSEKSNYELSVSSPLISE